MVERIKRNKQNEPEQNEPARTEPEQYEFSAALWEHDGDAAWHFVSLPDDIADAIADRHEGRTRGFGSIKVTVTVGATQWSTSLFPDSKRGTYVLPMKRAVRTAERLSAGDTARIAIELAILPT